MELLIEFKFIFKIKNLPKSPANLVLERPEDFEISINGEKVSNRANGWYLDRSFKKIELPYIKEGENEIVLYCGYKTIWK
ncbi:MAG: hypothetical protein ACP5RW_06100 [bacterium]